MTSLLLALLLAGGQWGETVTVHYVMFNVNVLDRYGKPVTHLRRNDFRLWVDLEQVPLQHFSHDFSAPSSTLILLDASGSMSIGSRPRVVREWIRRFLTFRRNGDRASLILLREDGPVTAVPFPGEKRRFFDALENLNPRGKTALYDDLARVGPDSWEGSSKRRQVILITDSHDNMSATDPGTAIRLIRRMDVPVHVVCVPLSPREPLDIPFLQSLSRFTGGTLHVVKNERIVQSSTSQIVELIHHQYLLGFAPDTSGDVQYHRVQIDVPGHLRVRTRKGYEGYPPPVVNP